MTPFTCVKRPARIVLYIVACCTAFMSCRKLFPGDHPLRHFSQKNLVDNNGHYGALHQDSLLINAWGIAFNPKGVPWVNSQGGHVSVIYDKEGATLRPAVWIPGPAVKIAGNPTGIVFNGGTGFKLSDGKSAVFLFVAVDGVVSGWNPDAGDTALMIANNVTTSAYTGLALSSFNGHPYLYASDFRSKTVAVWDSAFQTVPWTFSDPALPDGYAPYGIQAVGDWLYVTYAKQTSNGREDTQDGLGIVDIYKGNGEFVKRFADGGPLNAPWGIAAAKPSFFSDNDDDTLAKAVSHTLPGENLVLVGNFGNGRINVYTAEGVFIGPLKSRGEPIVIDGLWAITFPPSTATAVDPDRLYFAAGPNDEKDGLFGYIEKQ